MNSNYPNPESEMTIMNDSQPNYMNGGQPNTKGATYAFTLTR